MWTTKGHFDSLRVLIPAQNVLQESFESMKKIWEHGSVLTTVIWRQNQLYSEKGFKTYIEVEIV